MSQSIFNLTSKTKDNFLKYTSILLETLNNLFLYKGHVANLTDLRAIAKPRDGEIRIVPSADTGYITYRFLKTPEDNMSVYGFISADDGTGVWGDANGHELRFITINPDLKLPAGKWFMYSSVRSMSGNFSEFGWGGYYLCRYQPGGIPAEYTLGGEEYPTDTDQADFRAYKLERKIFDRYTGSFQNPIFTDRLGVQRPNSRMYMYEDGSVFMRKTLRIRAIDSSTDNVQLRHETTTGSLISTWERTGGINRLYSPGLDLQLRSRRVRIINDSGNTPKQGSILKSIDTIGSTEWVHPTEEPPVPISSIKGVGINILGYNRQNSYFDVHYCAAKLHINLGLLHSKIPYGMYTVNISAFCYNYANETTIKATGYMYNSPVTFATVISKDEINMNQPVPRKEHYLAPTLYHAMNSDDSDWSPVIRTIGVNNSSYRDSVGTLTLRGNASAGDIDPNDSYMLHVCISADIPLESFSTPSPLLKGNRTALFVQSALTQTTTNTSSDPANMLIGGSSYFLLQKDNDASWVWEFTDGAFAFESIGFCAAISGQNVDRPFTELDSQIAKLDILVSDDGTNWTTAASVTNHNVWDDIAINKSGRFIKFLTSGSTNNNIYVRHCSITGDFV